MNHKCRLGRWRNPKGDEDANHAETVSIPLYNEELKQKGDKMDWYHYLGFFIGYSIGTVVWNYSMESTLIITLKEILIGYGISSIIGLILGIIIYYNGYNLD